MPEASRAGTRSNSDTLREYGRGLVGGLLFAFAPLYTMEVWFQGYIAPPEVVLLALTITYGVLVAYAYYVGLHSDRSLLSNLAEGFESLALGFLVAGVVLVLIGQLSRDLSAGVFMTRLTLEGMTCAIGVAIGSVQFGDESDDDEADQLGSRGGVTALVHQIAYTVLGATVVIAGVAPTEEVVVTGIQAETWAVLATALLSLGLATAIAHALDFRGAGRPGKAYAGGPLGDGAVTYAVCLVLSAGILWATGRFGGVGLGAALRMTVYLAFPTVIGGAIGRRLL